MLPLTAKNYFPNPTNTVVFLILRLICYGTSACQWYKYNNAFDGEERCVPLEAFSSLCVLVNDASRDEQSAEKAVTL